MQQCDNGARSVTPRLGDLAEREPDVEQDQYRGRYHSQERITSRIRSHGTGYRSVVQQLGIDVSVIDEKRLELEQIILRNFRTRQQCNRLCSCSLTHLDHID